jgi:hypothetical protein
LNGYHHEGEGEGESKSADFETLTLTPTLIKMNEFKTHILNLSDEKEKANYYKISLNKK